MHKYAHDGPTVDLQTLGTFEDLRKGGLSPLWLRLEGGFAVIGGCDCRFWSNLEALTGVLAGLPSTKSRIR